MNDNRTTDDNVLFLPETPKPFSVLVPSSVTGLVIIGVRPDGGLYFATENDSLGNVALLLDLAKNEVLRLAVPHDDDE